MTDAAEKPDMVQLKLEISQEVYETIQKLAEEQNITETELIKRALGMEKFLTDQTRKGAKLLLRRKGSSQLLEVIHP